MELYRQMKQISEEVAKTHEKKLYYGTVLSADPLSVKVNQRFTLTAAFLATAESLTELTYEKAGVDWELKAVTYETIVIRPGLAAGDKVVLISMGNSDYLILDRVV